MSDNQKKVLIDLIKEELNKEITEIKNIPLGNYAPICAVSKTAWEISGSTAVWVFPKKLREMAERLFPATSQIKDQIGGDITASNIGKKDFDEIISLIQQVNKSRKAENQKREQKRKEKLTTNSNLFFYWCKSSSGKPGAKENRRFEGRKDGKEFYLYIPVSHPDLANIPFAGQGSNDNKVNHFYLIEGFEMPTETSYHAYTDTHFYEKSVKLTDSISIVPRQENSQESETKVSYTVKLEDHIQGKGKDSGNWDYFYYVFTSEDGQRIEVNSLNPAIGFEAKSEKEEVFPRSGNNGIRYWHKISWKATEKDKRRFEKGDFVKIEKVEDFSNNNIGNGPQSPKDIGKIFEEEWKDKNNKDTKEVFISIILRFIQERNIKSIELTNSNDIFSDLIIIYNDGRKEICKYDASDGDERNIIRRTLKMVNEKSLDQQKLEKLQDSFNPHQTTLPTNSPKPSYVPYLIGGGVVIAALGAVWISYRLGQKKNK